MFRLNSKKYYIYIYIYIYIYKDVYISFRNEVEYDGLLKRLKRFHFCHMSVLIETNFCNINQDSRVYLF